jgi:hypothetical protein
MRTQSVKQLNHLVKGVMPLSAYDFIKRQYYRIALKLHADTSSKFQGKIFCVGFNKTGTSTIESALKSFGYSMGRQAVAEMLIFDWYERTFDRIVRYCETAQAFQDIPFSLPETYRFLDVAFPNSKFILTVRNSKEQWFRSMTRFHTKNFSFDPSRVPNEEDLRNAVYRYKGYCLDTVKMIYNYPDIPLYDPGHYMNLYERHNADVIRYFEGQADRLLVMNVSDAHAYQTLASFLHIRVSDKKQLPWKNKT